MKRTFLPFILLFCLLLVSKPCLADGSTVKEKQSSDSGQPIQIVADRLEAFNEKRLVVFSGNAVANQGDKTIKADSILLYYKKGAGNKEKIESQEMNRGGDLERMEAKGHVVINQGERLVMGDEAVFYNDVQKVVMSGNAVMREGRNLVKGERIVVFLNENRGYVESTDSKRVSATIYPSGKKDKQK